MKRKNRKEVMNILIGLVVVCAVAIAILFAKSSSSDATYGDDEIQMHYFYSRMCPHCKAQELTHDGLQYRYPNLHIINYEISYASSQSELEKFSQMYPDQLDLSKFGTPTTIIGDIVNIGFNPVTTQSRLVEMIEIEQKRINEIWDETTMTRTEELRDQK